MKQFTASVLALVLVAIVTLPNALALRPGSKESIARQLKNSGISPHEQLEAMRRKYAHKPHVLKHLNMSRFDNFKRYFGPTARNKKDPSIVGGYDADADTANYLVQLDVYTVDEEDPGFCTGTVIQLDTVLTAAHCFTNEDDSVEFVEDVVFWIRVQDFEDFYDEDYPYVFSATTVDIPRKYVGTAENYDIALVYSEISFDVNPDDPQYTALLATQKLKKNAWVYAAGYGITEEEGDDPDFLQEVELRARKFKKCKKFMDDPTGLDKRTMMCASAPKFKKGGQDTCQGDSGGPLFRWEDGEMVLYGVTSFGEGCARKKSGGWYAKVSFFQEVITTHMNTDINSIDFTYWNRILDPPSESG